MCYIDGELVCEDVSTVFDVRTSSDVKEETLVIYSRRGNTISRGKVARGGDLMFIAYTFNHPDRQIYPTTYSKIYSYMPEGCGIQQ